MRITSVLAALVCVATLTPVALAAAASPDCVPRVLVLGAMPLEVHPLLDAGDFASDDVVDADGTTLYLGRIADRDIALAMTGIGLVNAERATLAALEGLPCGVEGIVFSGVAGSYARIGDVMVAERWTLDDGASWHTTDADMLARARELEEPDTVPLTDTVPVGDDACACPGVETVDTALTMPYQPTVTVGGDGTSNDTYGDRALPCVPGGGDTFGCQPCLAPGTTAADAAAFAVNAPSYLDPAFFESFLRPPAGTTDHYASQDMESAAVARVAEERGLPFIAFRGVSDGTGDPLNLPGFPVQFFVYRHIAADNAAATTVEFLRRWRPSTAGAGTPAPGPTPDPTVLPATGAGPTAVVGLVLAALGLVSPVRRTPRGLGRRRA